MAICTYVSSNELDDLTTLKDKALDGLFQEVREIFKDTYYIREREYIEKRWFRKPKNKTLYILYKRIDAQEFQVINFFADNNSWLNTSTSKGALANYLCGLINGFNFK